MVLGTLLYMLTHEYNVSLELRESDNPWATPACCSRLPLHVVMLSLFAARMYQAAELETATN